MQDTELNSPTVDVSITTEGVSVTLYVGDESSPVIADETHYGWAELVEPGSDAWENFDRTEFRTVDTTLTADDTVSFAQDDYESFRGKLNGVLDIMALQSGAFDSELGRVEDALRDLENRE